jgi:hypothetical protein
MAIGEVRWQRGEKNLSMPLSLHEAAQGGAIQKRDTVMPVRLNRKAFDHAKGLVNEGKLVRDERDEWSEHRPSTRKEGTFIRLHGFDEYGKWFLGIDDEADRQTKGRYKFPYGDFENVHRCGVLSAESRAGQYKYADIELAAAHLHGMLDVAKR